MKIDRGIIKWQPFNSVASTKILLNSNEKNIPHPTFFPEEIEELTAKILEAYYANNLIELSIYEQNKIHKYLTTILQINQNNKTLKLNNNKTIFFNQIIEIKNI